MDKTERTRTEETEQTLAQAGREILQLARSELYLRMRFMDVALGSFVFLPDGQTVLAGTDGMAIYYETVSLGRLFRRDGNRVSRLYLHMVLHCVFRHLFSRKGREERLWNLACDIVTEAVIDDWNLRNVREGRSWLRRDTIEKLRKQYRVLTAERVYRMLEEWNLPEKKLEALEADFCVDDHRYWPGDGDQDRQTMLSRKWQDISEKMQTDMETFSQEASASAGHFLEQIQVENRKRYDYRSFLRRFAVLKEEMMVDEDSFDYVFYTYGLSLYGNMPLVEPQEWKEVKKVEEFVIAIDTSMSCSGEKVRRFLEETYSILTEQESFFRKVLIHIIQCDDRIQSDRRITSPEELREYMEHFDLSGEGGTDFRPVFARVEEMLASHELTSLRGMIYFTDGQGIYPEHVPPFETAFVFTEQEEEPQVPSWAIKLILDEEELERDGY